MGGSGTCRVGYGPVRATSAGCGGRAGGQGVGKVLGSDADGVPVMGG